MNYSTTSYFQKVIYFIFKLIYLCVIFICIQHFNENPFFCSVIAVICILFFLATTLDEITISFDFFTLKNGSIFFLSRKSKKYYLKDIQKINIIGDFGIGDELYNPQMAKQRSLNEIEIYYNNGDVEKITTTIYIIKLKRVKQIIDSILKSTHFFHHLQKIHIVRCKSR